MTKSNVKREGLQFAFSIEQLQAPAAGSKLWRVPVCPRGKFVKGGNSFTITGKTQGDIVANFASRPGAKVLVDYDHASLNPAIAEGNPMPGAGWIEGMDAKADDKGILWCTVEFTEKAAAMLLAKEYRYVSPVIRWGAPDRRSGEPQSALLFCMALTNIPFFEEMPEPYLLAAGWTFSITAAADSAKGDHMKSKAKMNAAGDGQEITCAHCSNVSEADMPEGHDQHFAKKGAVAPGAEPAKPAAAVEGEDAIAASTVTLADIPRDATSGVYDFARMPKGKKLVGSDVFEAQGRQIEALAAVETAVTEGRIAPAQRKAMTRIAINDLAGFREIAASMQTVDLGVRGHGRAPIKHDRDDADKQIDKATRERMLAASCTYDEALDWVTANRRDLVELRASNRIQEGR